MAAQSVKGGTFESPQLPYPNNALEPIISKQTVDYHWGKHLQAYVNNLNKLVKGSEFEGATLDDICLRADGAIYNNGAQVWNHIFYFEGFGQDVQSRPTGGLLEAIERDFGSFDNFKSDFVAKGVGQFGSGWVWLVKDSDGNLSIVATPNAENPLKDHLQPLLTFDVWEHAYYLDYQNRRADHLAELWKIVDWSVVEQRFNS
ncbi:MAG: superoxide dismutase [Rikenellaceae bacterium]